MLCAFRCLQTRSSNSQSAGKINGCSVVVNTSNDEKQVCSVHHGVHKNSYSPCGGWYNASTGPLVALVTQCFDTFCNKKKAGSGFNLLSPNDIYPLFSEDNGERLKRLTNHLCIPGTGIGYIFNFFNRCCAVCCALV